MLRRILISCASFLFISNNATIIHVIPLWVDHATKKWEILLSRNPGMAVWTDFDSISQQDPLALARDTISKYSRGRYCEKNAPLNSAIDSIQYGQHFFFLPVKWQVDNSEMRKARNKYKRDFVWIPMEEFVGYDPVFDHRQKKSGRITADPNLRAAVRILWPDIQKRLTE